MVPPSLLRATALLLLGLGAAAAGGLTDGAQDFVPPKLSFTAQDWQASLSKDGSVVTTSVQEQDEGGGELPWTVFQAVPSAASGDAEAAERHKADVRRRAGPLLTLFPDATPDGSGAPTATAMTGHKRAKHDVRTPAEQRAYLAEHGGECYPGAKGKGAVAERYDHFAKSPTLANLASELWKYCALYLEGGIFVDAETAPLAALGDVFGWDNGSGVRTNYVVASDEHEAGVSPNLLDGNVSTGRPIALSSVVAIGEKKHIVPAKMVAKLMDAPAELLEGDALLLPKYLMRQVQKNSENGGGKWEFLRQRCTGIAVAGNDADQPRTLRHCPAAKGYCCEVLDPRQKFVFLLSRQALVPNQILPEPSALPRPLNMDSASVTSTKVLAEAEADLPFIATVRQETSHPLLPAKIEPGTSETTPNLYELLYQDEALPTQEGDKLKCMDCLRDKKGADCDVCAEACPKFCPRVCDAEVVEKPVSKVLEVRGPRYRKDPERLIPRIVHQTWFEPVTAEKYPNMARLIESWKRSGWEYHFWDDASAADFLSLHFPPEVREAYEAIVPGAFKADLFRYCVLLIQGGIYADMDVMLESKLDAAVPPDVGFMVPVDAPGAKPNHRMCLWNGMIAAAPGHPFLAKAIEHVVNNARNRFTVVDYDRLMCPNLELSVVHAYSSLFTAGPCILGFTINEVTGRELQQTFAEGDLEVPEDAKGTESVPGRTIILQQNKWDMGAHRFTWVENNLVVAATDYPDYDDRKNLQGEDEEQAKHYSKTMGRDILYGQDRVYVNREISHDRIVMETQQATSVASRAA